MAMFETRPVGRREPGAVLLVAGVVVALVWAAWTATRATRDSATEERPTAPPVGVTVAAELADPHLVATRALTDFGVDVGARYVAVRILSEVDLEVRIVVESDLVLADDPRLCLVGPFSMPDYAGLSEPCWGEPDLSRLLRARLSRDRDGHPVLRADRAVTLRASLKRDADRCDYPPGEWRLEVVIEPLVEGIAGPPLALEPVELALATGGAGPLALVRPTNYCGIANVVYREQGEPLIAAADPDQP